MSKSTLLVFLQFAAILTLVVTTSIGGVWGIAWVLLGGALALMISAILSMSAAKLKIFPEPDADSKLIESGPYSVIRHPMYTAIMLGCSGLLLTDTSVVRCLVLLLLIVVLVIKLQYEEALLIKKFSAYRDYVSRTYRLIPFVF